MHHFDAIIVIMKTAIIFILLLVLAAGAFLSHPNQASFQDYLTARASEQSTGALDEWIKSMGAEAYAKSLTVQDRFLWTQVRDSDGKMVYLGLFSKWFRMGSTSQSTTPDSAPPAEAAPATPTVAKPTYSGPHH